MSVSWVFLCCEIELSATGRSHVQRSPTEFGCLSMIVKPRLVDVYSEVRTRRLPNTSQKLCRLKQVARCGAYVLLVIDDHSLCAPSRHHASRRVIILNVSEINRKVEGTLTTLQLNIMQANWLLMWCDHGGIVQTIFGHLMYKFEHVFFDTSGRIVVFYPDISTWMTGFAFLCVLQGVSSDSVSTVDQRQWRSNT
jgi:hypothetical protein